MFLSPRERLPRHLVSLHRHIHAQKAIPLSPVIRVLPSRPVIASLSHSLWRGILALAQTANIWPLETPTVWLSLLEQLQLMIQMPWRILV